jgi:hypothetical protein|tara:strand:- start:819 stop:1256 length:438 start_codon:yes stop_codon:yes gene_type:complete
MRKWRQGVFTPNNPDKFIGSKAIYRSGLELKFFRFCDNNDNVKKWGSENVIVPYISPLDHRAHRYYVDNYIEILEGSMLKKYLVEIKPSKQTKPPTTKYRKRRHLLYEQKAYVTNQAKWKAARKYSKKIGCEFIILTEKELIFNK